MSIVIGLALGFILGGAMVWFFYGRSLEQELQTAVAKQKGLRQQLADQNKNRELTILRRELDEQNAEADAHQEKLAVAEIEISRLQNEIKRADFQADELHNENKSLKNSLKTAVSQHKKLQTDLQTTRSQANALQTEKSQLNQQLAAIELEIKRQQEKQLQNKQKAPPAQKSQNLGYQLQNTQAQAAAIKTQIKQLLEELEQSKAELAAVKTKLSAAEGEINSLQGLLATEDNRLLDDGIIADDVDRLRDIKGIGPVYALRLHEAGIHTFEALAALTPEELEERFGVLDMASPEEWIEQAQKLINEEDD